MKIRLPSWFLLALLGTVLIHAAPPSPEANDYLVIQQAIEAGDLAGAQARVEVALRSQPQDAGLLNLRGILHAQRKEVSDARKDFSTAVRLKPGLVPAWRNLGRACQLASDKDVADSACAIRAWEKVARLAAPQLDPEAQSALALLYEGKGQYALSLHALDGIESSSQDETGNLLLRCADLAALHRVAAASEAASQLIAQGVFNDEDFLLVSPALRSAEAAPVVVSLVTNLDARHEATAASLQDLAVAYEQLKQMAAAKQTLVRIAALDKANPAHLIELARLAEKEGGHEEALGYLAHAHDLRPSDPHIDFLMAKVEMELDLVVEARHALERALAIEPSEPAFNYAMGFVILSTRDAATAGSYFQKFVDARPTDKKGHYALGVAYYASGDYTRSKEQLQMVESDPANAGGANYFLGCIARRENEIELAISYLEKSIQLIPDYSEAHTELARILMTQKNTEGARRELERAVELNPKSFPANEQLLVLYKRTHDPRAETQEALLKGLDQARSERANLMLRTVEFRP